MDSDIAKTILFAAKVIEDQWQEGGPSEDGQAILDYAESCGFIHWRKPTANELADEEWWGHVYEIGADTAGVGELAPWFRELKKAAKAAIAETV
jgi:hypothetical protein